MSAITVTKKDFKGTRRAKTLWLVAALLAVLAGLLAWVAGGGAGDATDAEHARNLFNGIAVLMSFLLPIVVMVASYLAIAGERESGGIKFLLGLPNSRRDVFVGKFLSRVLVVGLSVLFMFAVAVVVALFRLGTIPTELFLGIVALTLVYAFVFVSVAVSMSAFVRTRSRAIAGAIGVYFGLVIINFVPIVSIQNVVRYLHTELLGMGSNPDLYNFAQHLSPLLAFQKAKNLVIPEDMQQVYFASSVRNEAELQAADFGEYVEPELPAYLTDEFALVILALWLVVPLLIGYWRFQRADID